MAHLEHGDAMPSQRPILSLEIENRQLCRLDKATTLDVLASRVAVKDCKRGSIYPIIYTQMLMMSTRTGDPRAATAGQLLWVLYSDSSHPLDISTARSHLSNIFLLASLDICGLNMVWSWLLISFSSSNSFQTSTAKPAAMAAPSDVVSRIAGRSTGIPIRSACVCGD